MEGASNATVPGFLIKLWTLVDDTILDDVIRWSENGHSFLVVNEQIFAKEILPKYFKHNNISSFIRQLNLYGFRKVLALENGKVIQGKTVSMEFQHPFFRKGGSSLLENIKRKVPTMKIENVKIYPDELQRMMTEVQDMRDKQSNMDAKFAELKKEYAALWLEVTDLRQKYCKQQQLLTQILQFMLNLIGGNYMVNKDRKRSLPLKSGASASKCAHQYFHIPEEKKKEAMQILQNGYTLVEEKYKNLLDNIYPTLKDQSKTLVSCMDQASGDDGKDFKMSTEDIFMNEDSLDIDMCSSIPDFQELMTEEYLGPETEDISLESMSSPEDNDSIFTEDKSDSQCNTIMNRDEMYMQCIERNLVEIKSLLSRKKLNCDAGHVSETLSLMNSEEGEISLLEANGKKDKQVVEYKKYTLLSLLDEVPENDFGERLQDSNDLLLNDLKNPSLVLPDFNDHDYIALNVSSPEDVVNPIENSVPQLCVETNGESKLFPLLFLSPVTNFVDESIKVEPST
ncbi:heat shock factor protein 3-like [Sciurus carolinensis]|uniref:heat shock factor protein 3-like n=1 Tax=Sciurus carolinensis TaxID=30640 RepID=UPI001FB28A6C|nr:heat shock factor protein 3-like [Sciurus carolinensis]